MRLPQGGAVTGWAALRLAGAGFFDGVAPDGRSIREVPLVLPPGRGMRGGRGFGVHRERLPPEDLVELHGISCTTPARATFDEARWTGDIRDAVVVIDMALAAGVVSTAGLRAFVEARSGWPGSAVVRGALDLSDGGSRSPQETRLRLIWMLDARYPRPRCNPAVGDTAGNWIGRPDLLCEEFGVVGEYDGAFHRSRDRHRADVRREDLFRRAGLEMFTVVGGDLSNVGLVVDRMNAAVARAREAGRLRSWSTRR